MKNTIWASWPVYVMWSVGCCIRANAGEPVPDRVLAHGEHLARMQCSACHVVASNQEIPPLRQLPTPSFQEIANRPDTTQQSLQHFIAVTHWDNKTVPMTMPDQLLSKDETVAVVRYILSLRHSDRQGGQ